MKVELLDSNLNLRTKYLVPQIVSLSDVFQVVGSRKQQVGYPELRRDVKKKGFKNPIVLIPNTLDNYGLAIRQVNSEYIKGGILARFFTVIGDKEKAFKWLKISREEKDTDFFHMYHWPIFDEVRSDPEFVKIYKDAGLYKYLTNKEN